MSFGWIHNTKIHLLLLAFFFIAEAYFLYLTHGIIQANDSVRYLEISDKLAHFQVLEQRDLLYLGYCVFLAFFQFCNFSIGGIVLVQLGLAFLGLICFYKSATLISKKPIVAFLTSLVFLAFIDIHRWNFYILTESFYFSVLLMAFYFWIKFDRQKSKNDLYLLLFLAFIILFSRPVGFVFCLTIATYFYVALYKNKLSKIVNKLLIISSLCVCFLLLNTVLNQFELAENYQRGEVIFNISKLKIYHNKELAMVKVPADLHLPSEASTLKKAVIFHLENPVFCAKLFFLKSIYFISHTKPYYSITHNIYLFLLLFPAYFGFFLNLKSDRKNTLTLVFFAYLVAHCLIIGFCCEDWDGRFFVSIVPVLFLVGYPKIISTIFRLKH
jgi:hypothetical protein